MHTGNLPFPPCHHTWRAGWAFPWCIGTMLCPEHMTSPIIDNGLRWFHHKRVLGMSPGAGHTRVRCPGENAFLHHAQHGAGGIMHVSHGGYILHSWGSYGFSLYAGHSMEHTWRSYHKHWNHKVHLSLSLLFWASFVIFVTSVSSWNP